MAPHLRASLAAGRIGERILASLPRDLARGEWQVTLADVPGEPPTVRYGFYGFQGTGTIGVPPHASEALTSALQLRFGNEALRGRVLGAHALTVACATRGRTNEVLAWVQSDGRIVRCGQ